MAGDLFNDAGSASKLARLVACVDRELGMRARVYPRWVKAGKLTEAAAGAEMSTLAEVRGTLLRWAALEEYVDTRVAVGVRAAREVACLEAHYRRMYPPPAVSFMPGPVKP